MEIYAHWLDGEHLRVSGWGPQDTSLAVMLKIQALLGHTVVLSDVQLIDSHAVQALFETEDFRSFVRGCPSFLRCTTAAPAGSDPFALVTTGLHRALEPGWLSSSFDTAEPLVRLSEAVLERGEANPGPLFARGTALGARYEEGGVIRRRLEAVAWTLHHFSREAGVPLGTSAVTRPCSYRDVLEEVAELPGLPGHDYAPVERTLAHLDEHVEPSNRHRRAVLFAQLDATDPPHRTAMWNTATQAWNAAVQRTLGTDGASPRSLPKAADIGLYLGRPTDALFEPACPGATAPAEHGLAPGNLAAVAELDWQDIAKIHQDEVVTRRHDAFQAALRAGDAAAADDALPPTAPGGPAEAASLRRAARAARLGRGRDRPRARWRGAGARHRRDPRSRGTCAGIRPGGRAAASGRPQSVAHRQHADDGGSKRDLGPARRSLTGRWVPDGRAVGASALIHTAGGAEPVGTAAALLREAGTLSAAAGTLRSWVSIW